jgi:CBS domain-containing protein
MPPSATVKEACRQMGARGVGSVLVTDKSGALLGIFTGRDAVRRIVAQGKIAARTTLGQVMTPNPTTLGPDCSAIEALRLMWDGGFRHIPILRGTVIEGVVSRGDFQGCENELLEEERALWEHMR